MTEQNPHGFTDPPTPIIRKPNSRADVDRKKTETIPQEPERKFGDKDKIRKMNAQGLLVYDVYVVSAKYDEGKKEWMYKLTDCERKELAGETEETKLGC